MPNLEVGEALMCFFNHIAGVLVLHHCMEHMQWVQRSKGRTLNPLMVVLERSGSEQEENLAFLGKNIN